jgi:hypothetical protein
MTETKTVKSLKNLIKEVKKDYKKWDTEAFPWFRGEPYDNEMKPLLPKIYRDNHNENRLLQQFRVKAPALGYGSTPPIERTDQWLFLAQHVGLPTRLLDWTEGLLIALYFALQTDKVPVVWMLNPHALNSLSVKKEIPNAYSLTWFHAPGIAATKQDIFKILDPKDKMRKVVEYEKHFSGYTPESLNAGSLNIKAAWETDKGGTDFPYAILPTYVHPRMSAQKSRFTIWGKDKRPLNDMEGIDEDILRCYKIDRSKVANLRRDLQIMGITPTSIFADLDNLAKELTEMFLDT